jgi:hypothetical protein
MPFMQLTIESLKDLDAGRVKAMFDHELKRAVLDCFDRPGDKNARSVVLNLKLTPIIGENGDCDGVAGEFSCKGNVPTRRSKTYEFNVNRNGQLAFSSSSPTDRDQTTIEDIVDPESGRVER